jgi:hypothetical protein
MDLLNLMKESAGLTKELHAFLSEKAPSNAHAAMAAISYVCAMHLAAHKENAANELQSLHDAVSVVFSMQAAITSTFLEDVPDGPLN